MKEEKVKKFYDKISNDYLKTHGFVVSDIILERIILDNIPKNEKFKILDAGGGCGRFTKPLLNKGHRVVLSDISQGMLEEAKKIIPARTNLILCQESVTNLVDQKDNSFDIVMMINAILDYCGDYNKAMQEAFRVLKEGGIFIGHVNNRLAYCKSHELKEENYELFKKNMKTGDRYIVWAGQEEGHLSHEFTLEELKNSLQSNGFKIIKILGVFNLMDKGKMDVLKNAEKFIELQLEFAKKIEYVNNSSDFFFVASKGEYKSGK